MVFKFFCPYKKYSDVSIIALKFLSKFSFSHRCLREELLKLRSFVEHLFLRLCIPVISLHVSYCPCVWLTCVADVFRLKQAGNIYMGFGFCYLKVSFWNIYVNQWFSRWGHMGKCLMSQAKILLASSRNVIEFLLGGFPFFSCGVRMRFIGLYQLEQQS